MTTREITKGLPWEEAAEVRTVIGWACKTCNLFYGDGPVGEGAARYCCASDAPCECGGRRHPRLAFCDDCRAKRETERYWAMEEVDWDGKTPLVDYNGDHYLFDSDDLADYLDECEFSYLSEVKEGQEYREVAINHVHLCLCKERPPIRFDLYDLLSDDYGEAGTLDAAGLAVEKAVNDWLALLGPTWEQANTRPSLASLRSHLGLPAVEQED